MGRRKMRIPIVGAIVLVLCAGMALAVPGLFSGDGGTAYAKITVSRKHVSMHIKKVDRVGYKYTTPQTYVKVYSTGRVWFDSSDCDIVTGRWGKFKSSGWGRLYLFGHNKGTATIKIRKSEHGVVLHRIRVSVSGGQPKSKTIKLKIKTKKITNGRKYTTPKKTEYQFAYGPASWKSSDYDIAACKWGKERNGVFKLYVYGYNPGKATITIYNKKKTVKRNIHVKVTGGSKLGFRFMAPAKKRYVKKDGTNGYYRVDRVKLINHTDKKVLLSKKTKFKYWTVDADGDSVDSGELDKIRNLPIGIKKRKGKELFIGEKRFESDDTGEVYWSRAAVTLKVGKRYQTIYVNENNHVTKMHYGRDF